MWHGSGKWVTCRSVLICFFYIMHRYSMVTLITLFNPNLIQMRGLVTRLCPMIYWKKKKHKICNILILLVLITPTNTTDTEHFLSFFWSMSQMRKVLELMHSSILKHDNLVDLHVDLNLTDIFLCMCMVIQYFFALTINLAPEYSRDSKWFSQKYNSLFFCISTFLKDWTFTHVKINVQWVEMYKCTYNHSNKGACRPIGQTVLMTLYWNKINLFK